MRQSMRDILTEHKKHIRKIGNDLPEILNWKWEGKKCFEK